MRRQTASAALATLLVAPVAIGWTSAARPQLTLQPQSRLWINGTSTVRSFECASTAFEAKVDAVDAASVAAIVAGGKVVRSAELTVPAKSLDCRNATMNEHMLKALKAKEHPVIAFKVSSYDVAKGAAGAEGTATGQLTLGGVAKPITVKGTVAQDASGALHITGSYPLRMTEYGLKPPSLMMGTMKVNELVKVSFDLLLKS